MGDKLQLLYSEYKMLIMAVKDWTQNNAVCECDGDCIVPSNLKVLNSKPAINDVKTQLMNSMAATMDSLPLILAHRTEDSLRKHVRDPDTVKDAFSLDGVSRLYEQLNDHFTDSQRACPSDMEFT